MFGFTYNGVHSSRFGCYYIPDENDLFDDRADYDVIDDDGAGHDGGYYYGSRVKPREFSVSCYYEDISKETKQQLMNWLDRRTSGKLIFDERPFVEYNVRPTKKLSGKMYMGTIKSSISPLCSGTFEITFTAYDPFGYLTEKYYTDYDLTGVSKYCGMIEKNDMPALPTTQSRDFLIYNCGTETCGARIKIGGVAPSGLKIINDANGDVCSLLALPPSPAYLDINASDGTVKLDDGTMAFVYSDQGYITLETCGYIHDIATFEYTAGSNEVVVTNKIMGDEYVGKYVYLNKQWLRIIGITLDGNIVLNQSMSTSDVEQSRIVTMNHLRIVGDDIVLDKLDVEYTPRIQ